MCSGWTTDRRVALAFALRRLEGPVRLVVARRSGIESTGSRLAGVLPDDSVVEIQVGPLSLGAMQALFLVRLNRTFARPALRRIHTLSAGNPFFALEIARALDGPVDPTEPLPIPGSLEALMAKRLAAVPSAARGVVGYVATHGSPSLDLLRAAGMSDDELDLALEAQVLVLDGSTVVFAHPLLASAAYDQLLPGERRRLHQIVAGLVDNGVARARHLALGAAGVDLATAATLDSAAEQARARGALGTAAELRAHALRLTPDDDATARHRRTIALAQAHLANGNHARANELSRSLMERTDSGIPRAETILLLYELDGGHSDLTVLLLEALDHAVGSIRVTFRLCVLLGGDLARQDRIAEAEDHASTALKLAEEMGEPALIATALWVLAAIRMHRAESDASQLVDRAFDLCSRIDDSTAIVALAGQISGVFIWSGAHEPVRRLLEPACDEISNRDELAVEEAMWKLVLVEFVAGRLRTAEVIARRHQAIVTAYYGDGTANGSTFPLALTLAFRGQLDEARLLAEDEFRADPSAAPWARAQMEGVLGRIELWTGSPETACDHFAAAEERLPSIEPSLRHWRAEYVEALLVVDRRAQAAELLDNWDRTATRLGRVTVLAEVCRCRGLAAAARGDVIEAEALLERAAAESAAVGDPIGRARALLALGRARRRTKQKRGSRDALQFAADIFHECGADGLERTARAELSSISGRRRHEGLTPAERRVADLAAEGRTNREVAAELFLSLSTVETHLSHVYAKLGIRSRTELARTLEPH